MNTIKFNNHTYEVLSFNKNTYFNETGVGSNANCQIKTADITSLYELAEETIETLQIYHDNELIYNLSNLSGKLSYIDEYLAEDRINITLNCSFVVDTGADAEPAQE